MEEGFEFAKIMMIASAIMTIVIGFLMVFIPLSIIKKKRKHCTLLVIVTCKQLEEIGGTVHTEPIGSALMTTPMKARLEGQQSGQPVIIEKDVYAAPHPQIGDTMELLVNPDNYNDYMDPAKKHTFEYIIVAFGAITLIAGIYQAVVMIYGISQIEESIENGNVINVSGE